MEMLEREKLELEKQKATLLLDKEEEKKVLDLKLEEALKDKELVAKTWEQNYEKMRTVNIIKEQELLEDFEWKLREIQQTCKKKLQDKDKNIEDKLQEVYKDAENKKQEAESIMSQVRSQLFIPHNHLCILF